MVAKIIGYTIGILFGVGVIIAPLFGLYIYTKQLYFALTDSTYHSAEIVECHYRRVRKGSGYSGTWGPVAQTKDGIKVKGDFTWKNKDWCTSGIGDKVSVFISNRDPKHSQVNTFFQLWFLPSIFISLSIIWYTAIYKNAKKKYFKKK